MDFKGSAFDGVKGQSPLRYSVPMMFPPALPEHVKARAFRAPNGELGILPADAGLSLDACRADRVEVLGWELWVIDHEWGRNGPVAAVGQWCGGIPLRGETLLAVIAGKGDADETEQELAAFDFIAAVQPDWLPHVRVNFTLRFGVQAGSDS